MLDRLRRFRERFPLQAIAIEVFAIVLGVLVENYPHILQALAEQTGSTAQSDTTDVDSLCQSPFR